jgi:hypothetical protein
MTNRDDGLFPQSESMGLDWLPESAGSGPDHPSTVFITGQARATHALYLRE